jgi:hypothetical protein
MNLSPQNFLIGAALFLVQVLAAVPWLLVVNWNALGRTKHGYKGPEGRGLGAGTLLVFLAAVAAGCVVSGFLLGLVQEEETLKALGRAYGAVLQLQLCADLVIAAFLALLLVVPKVGAVAVSAFREGVRQPMFWLLAALAALMMVVSPFVPYFTFGEDHKMVEELGYDLIMLAALLFGALAASMTISEEIEGKTAITLMSKPVSRRQFLLGKFLGILLAGVAMTMLLGLLFDGVMLYKRWYDSVEAAAVPTPWANHLADWLHVHDRSGDYFCQGIELWGIDAVKASGGLIIGFCQVMVLIAIAVSLATRLPMVINLVVCLGVYFLGHLTPVLVQIAQTRAAAAQAGSGQAAVAEILKFMAQLFDTLLPGLDYFSLGTAVVRDNPLPSGAFTLYIASVVGYAVLYTLIVLFFGLILFEDRDLA